MSFTTSAITAITGRNCIRFTELAYVVVAVFDSGRAQFVGKAAIKSHVEKRDNWNRDNTCKLIQEWVIKPQQKAVKPSVELKRIERAGFENVRLVSGKIYAELPADKFDAETALHSQKQNGWNIVIAA